MWINTIPALPFFAFLFLLLFGTYCSRKLVAFVGFSGIFLSFLAAFYAWVHYFYLIPNFQALREIEWTWLPFYTSKLEGATIQFAFYLDALSMLMVGVITFVGSLIAFFSIKYMDQEQGLARYFACMNLFVSAMLVLVLADNFLLLFLGWEGVGLCSYLLIGFWYEDPTTGRAAIKSFVTTRVGDVFLLFGLFFIFQAFGTLSIQETIELASAEWPVDSVSVTVVCFLLLGGAVGKSAQVPLHIWLPDAMKGPTPASALIHAATMVTAGVYLIARTGGLFALAPVAQNAVLFIGAVTLLYAGFTALQQTDMKRVLAYSTISQIGYMFLALGAGAYSAAMFHFLVHAFFKSLLFLAAGAIGYSLHHDYNMYKMGALKKKLPKVFWTFVIGSGCLSALPLVTAGFYSKEFILSEVYASPIGGLWPWVAGCVGAFITALYTFRMVFISFYGESDVSLYAKPDFKMYIPLYVLAFMSLVVGFLQTPSILGDIGWFSDVMRASVLPSLSVEETHRTEWILLGIATVLSLAGVLTAYILYLRLRVHKQDCKKKPEFVCQFLKNGFYVDWFIQYALVKPYEILAKLCRKDFTRFSVRVAQFTVLLLSRSLSLLQNGHLRLYVLFLVLGALVYSAVMVFA